MKKVYIDTALVSLTYHSRISDWQDADREPVIVERDPDGVHIWVEEWRGTLTEFLDNNIEGLTEDDVLGCCEAVAFGSFYQFDGSPNRLICLTPAEGTTMAVESARQNPLNQTCNSYGSIGRGSWWPYRRVKVLDNLYSVQSIYEYDGLLHYLHMGFERLEC